MKTIYTFLTAALILVAAHYASAQSQTEIVLLLDTKGKEVHSISDAFYYEELAYNSSGEGTRTRYLIEDSSKVSLYTYSDLFGGEFKTGVLHGPYYSWYKSGKKQHHANYTDGKLSGDYKRWYENGQLNYKMQYREGVKHDTLIAFYETGEIRRTEVYNSGELLNGKLFDKDGRELDFFPMEQMPEFPGGEMEMMKWVSKNVRYPSRAYRAKAQGMVVVSFVVDKDGTITETEILKSVHPDIDAEAIRVIIQMPKWKPGKQEGEPVRVRYSLPLKFSFN